MSNHNYHAGAHPPFAGGDRCPRCRVPWGAPHLNSCGSAGVWFGSTAQQATGGVRPADLDEGDDEFDGPRRHPEDDEDEDDEDDD